MSTNYEISAEDLTSTWANITEMLPASVKKMIRRKSLQCSVDQEEPTAEQYIYRRHFIAPIPSNFSDIKISNFSDIQI